MKLTPEEQTMVGEREAEVQEGLKRFYNRTHWEPCTDDTPLSQLMASEEGTLDEWAVIRETGVRMLEWIASGGPHPAELLKRLFALGAHMYVAPFNQLNLREMGMMLGDSHAAHLWRMQRLCIDPLRRKGRHSIKAPGQKSARASEVASRAQLNNTNRKDGKKRKRR